MSLYTYTGEPGRVFPSLPVTPEPGDTVDWGDVVPDGNCWTPAAKKATANRTPDNAEAPAEAPVDVTTPTADQES